ncbi:MAG: hypothetical protein ISS48_02550 [Candidatus Aenigmarchaeota archaeon]|nr:hypothetical protein [Candidatus Aenigmarchaeota archaeon]
MKEFIEKRIRLNGKTVKITEPKQSITFEKFIEKTGPIIRKMAKAS